MDRWDYRLVRDEDIEDELPFPHTRGRDPGPLRESIRRAGQVNPILLWPKDGTLRLLAGTRRRAALRDLGVREYRALVLPQSVDGRRALVLALEDNLGYRTFNDAEIVMAVGLLARFFTDNEIRDEYLPRLGLPPRAEYLDRFRRLSGLGPEGLDALADGSLDPATAETLLTFGPEDRDAAAAMLRDLRPGLNKRRQMITWLEEVARREGAAVREVLVSAEIREVLDAQELNRPMKLGRLREVLRARRYPTLARLEAERAALLRAMDVPAGIRLSADPAFEGLGWTLSLEFENVEDLGTRLGQVTKIRNDPRLADLLDLG